RATPPPPRWRRASRAAPRPPLPAGPSARPLRGGRSSSSCCSFWRAWRSWSASRWPSPAGGRPPPTHSAGSSPSRPPTARCARCRWRASRGCWSGSARTAIWSSPTRPWPTCSSNCLRPAVPVAGPSPARAPWSRRSPVPATRCRPPGGCWRMATSSSSAARASCTATSAPELLGRPTKSRVAFDKPAPHPRWCGAGPHHHPGGHLMVADRSTASLGPRRRPWLIYGAGRFSQTVATAVKARLLARHGAVPEHVQLRVWDTAPAIAPVEADGRRVALEPERELLRLNAVPLEDLQRHLAHHPALGRYFALLPSNARLGSLEDGAGQNRVATAIAFAYAFEPLIRPALRAALLALTDATRPDWLRSPGLLGLGSGWGGNS